MHTFYVHNLFEIILCNCDNSSHAGQSFLDSNFVIVQKVMKYFGTKHVQLLGNPHFALIVHNVSKHFSAMSQNIVDIRGRGPNFILVKVSFWQVIVIVK